MKPFAERTKRAQVESLRKTALAAAVEFGIQGTPRLVFHGFNTTFRFTTPEGDFAMRINVNSRRTEAEIRGEIEFIRALQARTDLILPTPRTTRDQAHVLTVKHPDFDQPLPVVAYSWLDGKHLHEGATGKDLFEVGQLMRKLHEGADGLTFAKGSERHLLVNFMDGIPIRTPDRAPFSTAVDLAHAAYERIIAHEPPRPVHGDVHFGNIKRTAKGLAVFDFDDSFIGWRGFDVAQSLFYLRRVRGSVRKEQRFWEGLGATPFTYGVNQADIEALVAGRAILLASELMNTNNADLIALRDRYLRNTEARLNHFLAHGRFDTLITAESPSPA